MKVLFDQNAPRPLAKYLTKHAVTLALDLGWDRFKNGTLLEVAEAEGFDLMVTSDKNLEHQQNLNKRNIALVILPSGRWPLVKPQLDEIVQAVDNATPGSYQAISLTL